VKNVVRTNLAFHIRRVQQFRQTSSPSNGRSGTVIIRRSIGHNNRGFVYASMNAIAREVETIDWRLLR